MSTKKLLATFVVFLYIGIMLIYHLAIAPATKEFYLTGTKWAEPPYVIKYGETGTVSGRTMKFIGIRETNGTFKAVVSIDDVEMEPITLNEEYEIENGITFRFYYEIVQETPLFIFKHNIIKNVGIYFYPEDVEIYKEKDELR